jgi:uncharacterized protein (TIGR03437 family)
MRLFLALGSILVASFSAAAQRAPALAIDAAANTHPISPYIYGINEYTDAGLGSIMRIPVRRWGGDADTSYNWQIDVYNSASDWYFANFPQYSGSAAAIPDGGSFDLFHEANLKTGAFSVASMPILDWTPKDTSSCSYPVSLYGAQQKVNDGCGNGIRPNGSQIAADPTTAYQPSTPEFQQQWVDYIMHRYGPANAGGVRLWSMDNEPEWWYGVHIDIYQQPATYNDMMLRNLTWAQAVKAADPTALVTGPIPGGWSGMLFSSKDIWSGWTTRSPWKYWDNPVDYKAHGSVYWVPYYLQQMQKFERQNGYRLLDVLDVHAYIQPSALSSEAGDTAMETLRMTSTRALWDPGYIVPGGGYEDANGNEVAMQLIPRLRQWMADNYPGTKVAIGEYWWHALDSITGAIAQADVLGIFGREQLDYGMLWGPPAPTDPGAFAFKIFLNYDGNGSQFGGTSVSATSDNWDTLSIFAAERYDSALTVLVLNKTTTDLADTISLQNFTPAGTAQVWQYGHSNLGAIVHSADIGVASSGLGMTFPAYSMTLLVIPQAQTAMTVPQPVVTAVSNAASYDTSGIAPGEILAIWGQGLGPNDGANLALDSNGLLTTSLAGTQVFVNGNPAPLVYASNGQVDAIVPYEIAPASTASVVVVYQGNASAPATATIAATRPGIFTNDGSGLGQGAILNPDYSLNGPSNPAPRGQYVMIYATGEGVTTPPGVDGRVTDPSGKLLPLAVASCTATIGGTTVAADYCGEAPGSTAGLVQMNVKLPTTIAPASAVPVTIAIGGVASQAGVTLAVE